MPPSRTDTGSTTSETSHNPVPIPPGFYTLPIHGNCPRCHHYHEAVSINVRVSGDPHRVSHVYCERCKEKWLAFGGTGSTRISLLSTRTIEPDVMENRFRYALIDMVRSVTSIASPSVPALATLPEVPSRGSSRRRSGYSSGVDEQEMQPTSIPNGDTPSQHHRPQNPQFPQSGARMSWLDNRVKSSIKEKLNVQRIKKRIKSQFKKLQNYDTKRLLPWKKARREAVEQHPQSQLSSVVSSAPPRLELNLAETRHLDEITPATEHHLAEAPASPSPAPPSPAPTSSIQHIPNEHIEREKLRTMTKEQRINWLRGQFTEFKYHHASHIIHRRTSSSMNPSVADSNDPDILPPAPSPPPFPRQFNQRRHSDDVLLTGSHLISFEAGELFYESRPFSIDSTTRLSQAITAVSSDGLGTGSELAYSEGPPRRHSRIFPAPSIRSRRSLLRYSFSADHVNGRTSMDSTAPAVTSPPHLNGLQTSEERRPSSSASPLL